MLTRYGECTNCGMCCGSPDAPNRDSPWADNWPEAVRTWRVDYLAETHPIFKITGHPALGGANSDSIRLGNKTQRWIWVHGHGLCADAAPYGDTTTYEEMCPFLGPRQPDGTYPCLARGTEWEEIPAKMGCRTLPLEWDEASIEQWFRDHPACGFWYE